jgi:phospho-N-acetylmuramoyl-pentapeptide-transferase
MFICSQCSYVQMFLIFQFLHLRITQRTFGFTTNFSRVVPIHGRFKLFGVKDTVIVGGAYILSCFLALLAVYIGLISSWRQTTKIIQGWIRIRGLMVIAFNSR